MENIKANPTTNSMISTGYTKLIDGTDYNWDNDKQEMVIEKKGFIGEHSDIILSQSGDSISIKRVWIKGKEINADTMWCRESKVALSAMLDDNITFVRQSKDGDIVNKITKTFDDGMVQVDIKEYKNDVEVPVSIERIAIALVEMVDKDKIAHDSFLDSDMDADIKEAYLALDSEEKQKEFRENYSKMKIAQGVVSTVKVEENRIIKASDIDSDTAISIIRSEDNNHSNTTSNTQDNFKKLRDKLKRQVTNDYIVRRGRVVNGELDRLLTMKEVKEIDEEVSKLIENDKRLQVSADMSKINGVYDTLNNKNLDSQIAYEVKKEAFCNVYGYTPESFDAYMDEIFRLQEEKLSSGGYATQVSSATGDGFEETTTIQSMLNNEDVEEKARVKLVKINGWDDLEYKDKPIIYRSELLLKVIEEDKKGLSKEELEKLRKEDPNGMRLYDLMNDTLYNVKRWQKVRQKRKGEQGNVLVHKRSAANKSDVEKFMEDRKNAREERKQSGEIIDKISVEIKPNEELVSKIGPKEKTVDEKFADIIDDDIETVNTITIGDEEHEELQGDFGGRESGQDGSRTARRENVDILRETNGSSEDASILQEYNDTRGNGSIGESEANGRDNEPTSSGSEDSRRAGSRHDVEYEAILDDNFEVIEVIEDDRSDSTGDTFSSDSEEEHGERPSEVQRDINDEEPENKEEVTNVVPEENRLSEEVITTFGRRVYSENTENVSNIKIVEIGDDYNGKQHATGQRIDKEYCESDVGRVSKYNRNGSGEGAYQEQYISFESNGTIRRSEDISTGNPIGDGKCDTGVLYESQSSTENVIDNNINEVNENDDRENNRYNVTNNNDSSSGNGVNSSTSSSDELCKRGTIHIQSETIREDSYNEQRSESSSDRASTRTGDIMAERIEVKLLTIASDGRFILDDGRIVTPEEYKKLKDEGNLTVESMLTEEEVVDDTPNRIRITDDNLDNMFKLIINKKATWSQKDDMAVITIKDETTEYIYEPVSKFINKYTEFAMSDVASQTTNAKVKDASEIKSNIDELKIKTQTRSKLRDILEEHKKPQEALKDVETDSSVEVIEVADDNDLVDVVEYDDSKFEEYDRPLEAKASKVPDTYLLNRHHDLAGKIDEIAGVHIVDGDLSILRTAKDYSDVKKYLNSDVYSRDLYLPNSNYVVNVKRVKEKDVLTWMFQFLEDVKDPSTAEGIAIPQLIGVVYDHLDFPFETRPTKDEFLKNLHQSDITTLMSMFALINVPEDKDGRVIIPNISKFSCSKCGRSAFLKTPMSIDVKEEFFAIYPRSLWIENFGTYQQAKYPTIQKAYRASKVGARYMITDNADNAGFKIDVVLSRPTVYKQMAIDNNRYSVAYNMRLEELTNMLDRVNDSIPDEVLEAISYMADRSFNEVRNRSIMLDGIDLTEDPENIPEASREEYIGFQKEHRIIQFVMAEVQQVDEKLAPTFNSLQYIDSIIFINKVTGKPSAVVDHSNLYDMVDAITYLTDATVNTINKQIETLKNGYNGVSTNITFTPEEFKGKFSWDNVYQVINGKVLTEKEFLQHIQKEGGYSDEDMTSVAEYRKQYKENLEQGKCVCGNDTPWVLHWTDLLFFSTAKILGKTISTELDKLSHS